MLPGTASCRCWRLWLETPLVRVARGVGSSRAPQTHPRLLPPVVPPCRVTDPASGVELCQFFLEDVPAAERARHSSVLMLRVFRGAAAGRVSASGWGRGGRAVWGRGMQGRGRQREAARRGVHCDAERLTHPLTS